MTPNQEPKARGEKKWEKIFAGFEETMFVSLMAFVFSIPGERVGRFITLVFLFNIIILLQRRSK